jgi:GNAT superfamily N-acetyltransferase
MDIRRCRPEELEAINEVINAAAQAYRGVIAADRWKEPYMPPEELRDEASQGVVFWGCYDGDRLLGVMGLQEMGDVALIRHAYVIPESQHRGIGGALLSTLRRETRAPLLVGTWRAATWAVAFYGKHGFRLVEEQEKERLLRRYWTVPQRQIEESVVLEDVSRQSAADSTGG